MNAPAARILAEKHRLREFFVVLIVERQVFFMCHDDALALIPAPIPAAVNLSMPRDVIGKQRETKECDAAKNYTHYDLDHVSLLEGALTVTALVALPGLV